MSSDDDYKVNPYELAKAVRKLAETYPGRVYQGGPEGECNYTEKTGEPGCIFGHAMADLGRKLPAYGSSETPGIEALIVSPIDSRAWRGVLSIYPGTLPTVLDWMAYIQMQQDRQIPWGEAVRKADAACPDVVGLTGGTVEAS